MTYDAVIVGAGHNGLVAANILADNGWAVHVVEAQDRPGGAVRCSDVLGPGFTIDLFSAFYPFGAASPVLRSLDLPRYGLRWSHAPRVVANLFPDDRCVVLSRDLEETAASVESFGKGDGAAWRSLVAQWDEIGGPVMRALLSPFPPVRAGTAVLRGLRAAEALRLARFAVTPIRRLAQEMFTGDGAPMLLAGNAGHSDLSPAEPGSAIFGWLLCMLGQRVGFPVPIGGSERIIDALVKRLLERGGTLECGIPVQQILVRDGAAEGVRLGDGRRVLSSRGVLADVDAPTLFRDLVGLQHLPPRARSDLSRFQWDPGTLKLNWSLSEPVPWNAEGVHGAGTVHLGVDLDGMIDFQEALQRGRMPKHPFLVLGQMSTADPSRSPAGTETLWCYTHVPQALARDQDALAAQVNAVERVLERHAPGFRDLVLRRVIQMPADLEAADANLVNGAINGGSAKLHQELIFRPISGLGRPETPVRRLYLAGASAHPGGGVHGGPGANAARAALLHGRARTAVVSASVRFAAHRAWDR